MTNLKLLVFNIFFLCSVFLSQYSYSFTFNQSAYDRFVNDPMIQEYFRSILDPIDTWQAELTPAKFIFVNTGGILTPIKIEDESIAYRNLSQKYEVEIASNEAIAISSQNLVKASTSESVVREERPTLFITLHGASVVDVFKDGAATDQYQHDIATSIRKRGLQHNYAVWTVKWDSLLNNTRQVKKLKERVNGFLSEQKHAWDVVVVGFSRGGIFAHELSDDIEHNSKINKLYTILLDPTASKTIGDRYPAGASNSVKRKNYLYYDSETWFKYDSASTVSDKPIDGYARPILVAGPHEDIPSYFVDGHWDGLLNEIINNKGAGDFNEPAYISEDIVRINISTDYLPHFVIDDGVYAELKLGPVMYTASLQGDDGNVHASINQGPIGGAYAMVGEEGLAGSANFLGSSAGFTTVGVDGIQINASQFNAFKFDLELSTHDAVVRVEILGKDVKLDANGFIERLFGGTKLVVKGVGKGIGKVVKEIRRWF
ncbi:hypothetical protein [Marinagarivorans algicola]|uniref:hypothetical protein n=1 Tax=Marinagarivorans algicola TaxID=1513270 RepID=UPI0006B9A888|nr:hypothetical protein [Marinagarivorans algicola]